MRLPSNRLHATLALTALLIAHRLDAQNPSVFAGAWEGVLRAGPTPIQLIVEIEPADDGALLGRIIRVDQDRTAFPVDAVETDGESLHLLACTFVLNPIIVGASYEATLAAGGSRLLGTVFLGGGRFPLEMARSEAPLSSISNDGLTDEQPRVLRSATSPCAQPSRAPAERLLEEVASLVTLGTRVDFRAFVSTKFGLSMLRGGPERWVDVLSRFKHASHGFELRGVQQAGGNWVTGLLQNRLTEEWVTLNVVVEPEEPYRLQAWAFYPAPSPGAATSGRSTKRVARELEAYVTRLAEGDVFSGAVLLAKDGVPIFSGAYGMASKDFAVPNGVDTKFNLGSMNKMFTAVAIMQLVEAGRMALDDPLSKFVPNVVSAGDADRIQIQHLLVHTSGLGTFFGARFQQTPKPLLRTLDDLLKFVSSDAQLKSLAFEPGARWQYSNTGYLLLGKVVEVVSGQPYEDYVRDNVFEPAGMPGADFYSMDEVNTGLAMGYDLQFTDAGVAVRNNMFAHLIRGGAAGGGYATTQDLLAFAAALRSAKLLRPETVQRMLTPKPELGSPNYGYGFDVNSSESIVGHGGGFFGINSNLDMFFDSGWTAVVLSNYSEGGVPAYPSVVQKIRELVKTAQSD